MSYILIIGGLILCVISISYGIGIIKEEEKSKKGTILGIFEYIVDPFGGGALLYLGFLMVIAGLIF